MIEAIQVAAEATNLAPQAAALQPQASAMEVRQFAEAYERAGAAAGAPPAGAGGAQAVSFEGTRMVLTALERLNGGAQNIGEISKAMSANAADLTPGEMMQMTMRCHQFLFTSELTANVANRTSDGIAQLFRQQS
ncbi:hypothetical protein ACFOED_04115 [Vulcaniibacterium thermophilum]|jgi:hypothetical protein|uniref:Uncharacterized protein n=1 Tax=Vulcaniibacterium thermophilum TaxID=1169913 RepID=A0A918YVC3_9GAMM|nr:hypothetical protein [Vulcaniibacterium thermophilum]GHE26439.1 hypothetical protein GCM10007167_04590 [Vulcaniibacterium thermophilum]